MEYQTKDIDEAAWLWKSQGLEKPVVKQVAPGKCVFVFMVEREKDYDTLVTTVYPQTDHFDVSEGRKTLVRIIKAFK